MAIKILETFKKGKVNERLCEDAFFQSENYIAVIDGVTSKTDFLYHGKTTGKLASEIIYRVLETLRGDEPLREIVERVHGEITAFYAQIDFPSDRGEKGLQAACVIYSAFYREIWMIGDCQAVVDGEVYLNPKKSDVVLSEMRSLILSTLEQERRNTAGLYREEWEEHDAAREIILPWILRATIYANDDTTEYGYSVFNGQAIPESLIKVIRLREGAHEVILTSDGYPEVKETLRKTEENLKEILIHDPGCYKKYLSTKGVKKGQTSFDDRTYVRFMTD